MEQTLIARLVGPYGLNAVVAAFVLLFLGFLYLFNFTNFF